MFAVGFIVTHVAEYVTCSAVSDLRNGCSLKKPLVVVSEALCVHEPQDFC